MADERRSAMDVMKGSRILAYTVGVITLGAGLVLLIWPERTITVVARIAALLLVAVGLAELFEAVSNRGEGSHWGLVLLRGVVNVTFGAALLFWPGVTVTVLVWVFGLDLVITGVIGLLVSRRVPDDVRTSTVVRAVVSIVFGVLVMAWPSVTLAVLAVIIGLQLIVVGLILLWSGYALSKASSADGAAVV